VGKAAISLKHVKIEKKLLWRAYRNSPTLFRTVHPWPPTAFSSTRLEVRNPYPKLQSLLSQERVKLQTANLANTFTRSIGIKAHYKFWRKVSVAVFRDCRNFSSAPIISGMGKGTNFKLCTRDQRIDRNKRLLKNFRKSSHGRALRLPKIFRTPIYRVHRAVIFAIAQLSCHDNSIHVGTTQTTIMNNNA